MTKRSYTVTILPQLAKISLLAMCIIHVSAQQTLTQGQPPAASPSIRSGQTQASAELGPGDQLLISVADLDEVKGNTIRIAQDGTLDLPLIGVLPVGGMNVAALRNLLAARYAKYVATPQVTVQLVSSENRTVSVIGEVNAPNTQELTGPLTLLGAISKAGGIRPDAGPKVIITREARWGALPVANAAPSTDGAFYRGSLDVDDLLAGKTPENNISLRPGDVITVPKGSIVYVIGDVKRAGGFPLRSSGSISLVEALALAEGLGPNAKSGNAKILRPVPGDKAAKREEIQVDISQVLAGKRTDPQMFADDILFVPSSAAKTGIRRAAEAALQISTGILIYR